MNGIPDEDQGDWELCPIREPKPKPDVCPSGTYRIVSSQPDVHYHWRKKASEPLFDDTDPVPPEAYWWMGCLVVIVKKRDDGTAKTFVYQPSRNTYWWKTSDYPLPADALRISFPTPEDGDSFGAGATAHALTYERGFDAGYTTAWKSRSEIIEILLHKQAATGPGIATRTGKLVLDDVYTHDAARLVKIAEVLGIEVEG